MNRLQIAISIYNTVKTFEEHIVSVCGVCRDQFCTHLIILTHVVPHNCSAIKRFPCNPCLYLLYASSVRLGEF